MTSDSRLQTVTESARDTYIFQPEQINVQPSRIGPLLRRRLLVHAN